VLGVRGEEGVVVSGVRECCMVGVVWDERESGFEGKV
jgi:hypothetical protein